MDFHKKNKAKIEGLNRAIKLKDIELQKFQKTYNSSPMTKPLKRPNSANYNQNDETLKHNHK